MSTACTLLGTAIGLCMIAAGAWFAPRCQPDTPAVTVGGMLVAGCAR